MKAVIYVIFTFRIEMATVPQRTQLLLLRTNKKADTQHQQTSLNKNLCITYSYIGIIANVHKILA